MAESDTGAMGLALDVAWCDLALGIPLGSERSQEAEVGIRAPDLRTRPRGFNRGISARRRVYAGPPPSHTALRIPS